MVVIVGAFVVQTLAPVVVTGEPLTVEGAVSIALESNPDLLQ